eukprot:IDg1020t1
MGGLRMVAAESSLVSAEEPLPDGWRTPSAKGIAKRHYQALPCGRLSLSASCRRPVIR